MIIVLAGQDTYRSHKRMLALISAFKKKFDPSGYNMTRFEGQNPDFSSVQSAYGAMSFLGKKRMVLFEDFFSKTITEKQKSMLQFIAERDSEDHIVVFWQRGDMPGQSGRLSFLKKAKKEQFDFLEGALLSRWIQDYATERGLKLSAAAKQMLLSRNAGDLWSTANMLDQLASLVQEREATESDVREFSESVLDENIFHFTDALGAKNKTKALELLFDQLRSGAHPLYVLTMLIRQFRLLLSAKMNPESSAEELGVHPFALRKATEESRRFTKDQLIQAFGNLQEIDSGIKRGSIKDPETSLVQFVAEATK